MPRLRQYLLVFGMLFAGIVNLFADTCNFGGPINGLNVCWHTPIQSNSTTNPFAAWCSSANTTQCGYFYALTGGNGWNSLGPYGWHGYNGNGSAQAYLNTVTSGTGMSIALTASSSLHIGFKPGQYLNPISDNGYYLSTANSTNTPGITINFTSPIKDFALYWGSVDTWNTVTLKDTTGAIHTVSGIQLPSYTSWDPNGNNTSSILVHFSVPAGGKPWTQVSFTSCDTSGVCHPAFEFDNLEWVVAPSNCCGTLPAVPEPSALLLFGSGVAGLAEWLRRKARLNALLT